MRTLLRALMAVVLLLGVALATVRWARVFHGPAPHVSLRSGPETSRDRTAYPDFWDAVGNLAFEALADRDLSYEQHALVAAIQQVRDGNLGEAAALLRPLSEDAGADDLRGRTRELLDQVLLAMGRWKELHDRLEARPTTKPGDTAAVLARAFSGPLPPEAFHVPERPVALPMNLGWFGLPSIPVTLNGCAEEFLLDTGASVTVVAAHVANRCGVAPLGSEVGQGATSTSATVDFRPTVIDRLELGEIDIRHHRAAIVSSEDLSVGPLRIDGIVGWPVFQQIRVELDYARSAAVFGGRGSHPDAQERNLFWMGYPMVVVHSVSGIPLHFGLDTGARETSLKDNIFHKVTFTDVRASRGFRMGAGGGERVSGRKVGVLRFLTGRWVVRLDDVGTAEGVKAAVVVRPDGKIGSNAARGGRMVIDYPAGHFALLFQH